MGNEDCFAYEKGKCICLSDLYCRDEYRNFERHKCPFYKPTDVKNEPISRAKALLRNMAADFQSGMTNKQIALKYRMTAQEVAHKKEYLKRKGML